MMIKLDVEPMGAVRMTNKGKWVNKAAQNYLNYKKIIGYQIQSQYKQKPIDGPVGVIAWFYMPIPKSWSKKKQREAVGQYHTKKPDIDNLTKGLFDAANGLIWIDDNRVVDMTVFKVYGENPGIELEVEAIDGKEKTTPQEKAEQTTEGTKARRNGRCIRARI